MTAKGKFPSVLGELIDASGVSLRELARQTDISFTTLSQYRAGTSQPTAPRLEALADYFGVSVDYLLGRTDTKSPNADIQGAAELLGLSDDSIRALLAIKEDHRKNDALRVALQSEHFQESLWWCHAFMARVYDRAVGWWSQPLEDAPDGTLKGSETPESVAREKEYRVAKFTVNDEFNQFLTELEDKISNKVLKEQAKPIDGVGTILDDRAQHTEEASAHGEHHEKDRQTGEPGL